VIEIKLGVEVIVINWNTRELLRNCLDSLFRYAPVELPDQFELRVIVVDNASTDGSVKMLEAEFSQVMIIRNEHNVGFATANNQALAESELSYFWLLNSDTIVRKNSLKLLFEFMQNNFNAGVCAPRLLNGDNTLQSYSWKFPAPLLDFLNFLELNRWPRLYNWLLPGCSVQPFYTEPRQVDFVSGACLLVRCEAYKQLGGLDSAYFFYNEEADWCYRIKQAGWQVWYVPQAELVHLGGQSSQKVPYNRIIWFYQGYLRFYTKFYSRRALVGHRVAVWAATLPKLLILLGLMSIPRSKKRRHHLQLIKTYWKILWLPAEI